MSNLVAISGKGGVGKTAVAAGLVLCLRDARDGPVLAVDADPNSTLGDALGLSWSTTLADVRERKDGPTGIAMPDLVELGVEHALVEGEGVDLLVMGRPEGPGCYCAVNRLLRDSLRRVARRYATVVVDNEAGMEHLSRRTTQDVAALLTVAGPSVVSLKAARRVMKLAEDERLGVRRRLLVLNQWPRTAPTHLTEAVHAVAADRCVEVPFSRGIEQAYERAESLTSLGTDDPFMGSIRRNLLPVILDVARGREG